MAGTILYVDDAPELPEGFAREVGRLGFRLTQTSSPEEAVRLAREAAPRLVILEVLLRDGDGFGVLEQIRASMGPAGRVPVVVLTRGGRSPELYGRGLELGADDFLSKPVLRAELLASILECTERDDGSSQVDPAETDAGDDAPFAGDLADSPLPELLLRLRRIAATGVLLVQHASENRGIQLRNGSPVAVASNRGVEALEDYLVRTKQISGEEHEEVVDQTQAGLGSPRENIVAMGVLSAAELEAAIRQRAAEPMLEGFAWTAGSYGFRADKRLPAGRALELEGSPAPLLMEGALQWAPSGMIRRLLDRRGGHYVSKVDRPLYALDELGAAAPSPAFLDALLGEHTVAQVLGTDSRSERLLFGLLLTGMIEVHPEPVLELGQLVVETVEEEVPRRAAAEATEAAASDARAAAAVHPPESSQVTEDVLEKPPVEPARAPDATDAPEARQEAQRSLDAEGWFRRGEAFLETRHYDQALEAFGMAAHLEPDEGEYSAHVGYALYLSRPHNDLVQREALEHIAKGVKLSPERWKPLVFLARVFAASGDADNARKVLRRTVKLHPDCHAAHDELRRLNAPTRAPARSPGLLDRARGWLRGMLGR